MKKVDVEGVAKLPSFSHATIAGDVIYVSGTFGLKPDSMELVEGGMGPQTSQTIENIRKILEGCGASFDNVAKVNVYVCDMSLFGEMNEAYLDAFGASPPARIAIGGVELALGAVVEMDCIAHIDWHRAPADHSGIDLAAAHSASTRAQISPQPPPASALSASLRDRRSQRIDPEGTDSFNPERIGRKPGRLSTPLEYMATRPARSGGVLPSRRALLY